MYGTYMYAETLGTVPQEPSTLGFETGYLFLAWKLTRWLQGQTREPHGSTCVCVCGSGITKTYHHHASWLCNVGS